MATTTAATRRAPNPWWVGLVCGMASYIDAAAIVGTGIALGLPSDLAALTLPRSGLAARHGISIVNAPGLIDPGYRGEVRIILLNTDRTAEFHVAVGDRIAQLLFLPLTAVALVQSDTLDDTHRGERGFGSSGTGGR